MVDDALTNAIDKINAVIEASESINAKAARQTVVRLTFLSLIYFHLSMY